MCPFCISALALVAAKAMAASSGGAIVTKVVVSKMRREMPPPKPISLKAATNRAELIGRKRASEVPDKETESRRILQFDRRTICLKQRPAPIFEITKS